MAVRRNRPGQKATPEAAASAAHTTVPQGRPKPPPTTIYRRLFEHAPDAILVTDREGRYVDVNPAACELTGYTREELLRMHVGDLAVPDQLTFASERFALLREIGKTRADRTLVRKDGHHVHVDAYATDLGDGRYQTTLRDISERLAAQKEAKRSARAYRTLVELCDAAVVSAGLDGRITSWNPMAETLFGYRSQEAIGLPVTRLIPERLRGRHLTGFRQYVRSNVEKAFTRTLETFGLRKDGTEFPIEAFVTTWRQEDEQIITAMVHDLTEHREVVERLNDALQRLQFHVERMPLAYIAWDTGFRVMEWNRAAERIFGFGRKQAIGRHAYDLIVPPDARAAVDVVWADLLKGDTSSHSINDNVRKDGTRLTCEWFSTPLRDSMGRIRGAASMAMDVSEREALEAQVRIAQKLESLGVLTGGIAHDFNSSLMVILGNVALLRSIKDLPARAAEHIELIEDAGSRASELIRHLLTYARTGRHNPQPADLNAVLRTVVVFVRSSVGKKHELKLSLARRLPEILADKSQLEQIILNLCLNAKQAMVHGGPIEITTRRVMLTAARCARCVPPDARPGTYVELLVADTGYGMDAATTARIFDPFFTTKAEGHGLGLAAVMGIMRQHRAVALVDSKQDKGSRIHVFFPASPAISKPSSREPRSPRGTQH